VTSSIEVYVTGILGPVSVHDEDGLGESVLAAKVGQHVLPDKVPMTRMVGWNNGQSHVAEIATGERNGHFRTPVITQGAESTRTMTTDLDADKTGPLHHRRT
jgi:hypothetical protein